MQEKGLIEKEKIIVNVDEDIAELIPWYLNNRKEDIEVMTKALSAGDFEKIRIIGHTMKGSGAGYGLEQITEIGKDIETAAKEKNADTIRESIDWLSSFLEVVEVVGEE
jgi:HPt (histidine-containing phosphotransfer) domain-containing protein